MPGHLQETILDGVFLSLDMQGVALKKSENSQENIQAWTFRKQSWRW